MIAERLVKEGAPFASAYNFGPADSDAKPVSWIADQLVSAWGAGAEWTRDKNAHPAEAAVLRLNASKAARDLRWTPAMTLANALEWIVEWYKVWNTPGGDVAGLTRAQIARYEQLLAP
jgi:CDP-glucose 4,6-dehydratase